MRLAGWSRLGFVISALYAVLVVFITYDTRPRIEYLQDAWFAEAAERIAEAIAKKEGVEVKSQQVRDNLLDKGNTENQAWLEKVGNTPSEQQKLFSAPVKQVNDKHEALISKLPAQQRIHWLYAFAWWLGGTLLLFGSGWTIRWVAQGFRRNVV